MRAFFLACDKGQNLFCKGNDDAARKGQKAIRPLAWVMGLQRQAHLHDAPSEQDKTNRTDKTENKIREVIHHRQRVAYGKGCHGSAEYHCPRHNHHTIEAEAFSDFSGSVNYSV